ncbi:MAG: WD40 repeat domain-containing protein [Treponema sp.]|nr:WD40 repeat domain-containing protein [Treponema sp.]
MAQDKIYITIIAILILTGYILFAAQPIPRETILTGNWLKLLESRYAEEEGEVPAGTGGYILPFTLGNHFGYADSSGNLLFNKTRERNVSLSTEHWVEYDPDPDRLEIRSPLNDEVLVVENPGGYPLFMDGRIFLIGKDQTSLTELDAAGTVLWRFDFEAPLTCVDAAGGYVAAGTLDGVVDLLDSGGVRIFPSYAPGASRIPVILGCVVSSDGSKLAIISGVDKQRFLFLERYGINDYRVTHHEYLTGGDGFRREVFLRFIDNDSMVVFEREEGLGVFDIKSGATLTLPLEGRLEAVDDSGEGGILFFITAEKGAGRRRLIAIKFPSLILINAPFKSGVSFLARRGEELFIGGGMTLASFKLDKR